MSYVSSLRVSLPLCALALAASLVATVRKADACSPRAPFVEPMRPSLGELDVATNAKIWIAAVELTSVSLRGNNAVIEVDVTRVGNLHAYLATPRTALLPGVTYTVTAESPQVQLPQSWHFTTASGPSSVTPGTPSALKVKAELMGQPVSSCDPPSGTYKVSVEGAPVSGAVLYQLERLADDSYVPVELGAQPTFKQYLTELPTPTYRIRPIAMNGASSEETALPTGTADDTEDEGGCSASNGSSGAALSALLLVGLALSQRRRARRA